MDPEFADLVPLFVAEARGRLERLAELAARLDEDGAVAPELRRELHTLKGAARMLRLTPLAELCHGAEGALASPRPGTGALLRIYVEARPPEDGDVLLAEGRAIAADGVGAGA